MMHSGIRITQGYLHARPGPMPLTAIQTVQVLDQVDQVGQPLATPLPAAG